MDNPRQREALLNAPLPRDNDMLAQEILAEPHCYSKSAVSWAQEFLRASARTLVATGQP